VLQKLAKFLNQKGNEMSTENEAAKNEAEKVDIRLDVDIPQRVRVRVTRPSSSLHGLEGEGFRVIPVEDAGPEGGLYDPTVLYWIRFDRSEFPRQGWFEECEVEILA